MPFDNSDEVSREQFLLNILAKQEDEMNNRYIDDTFIIEKPTPQQRAEDPLLNIVVEATEPKKEPDVQSKRFSLPEKVKASYQAKIDKFIDSLIDDYELSHTDATTLRNQLEYEMFAGDEDPLKVLNSYKKMAKAQHSRAQAQLSQQVAREQKQDRIDEKAGKTQEAADLAQVIEHKGNVIINQSPEVKRENKYDERGTNFQDELRNATDKRRRKIEDPAYSPRDRIEKAIEYKTPEYKERRRLDPPSTEEEKKFRRTHYELPNELLMNLVTNGIPEKGFHVSKRNNYTYAQFRDLTVKLPSGTFNNAVLSPEGLNKNKAQKYKNELLTLNEMLNKIGIESDLGNIVDRLLIGRGLRRDGRLYKMPQRKNLKCRLFDEVVGMGYSKSFKDATKPDMLEYKAKEIKKKEEIKQAQTKAGNDNQFQVMKKKALKFKSDVKKLIDKRAKLTPKKLSNNEIMGLELVNANLMEKQYLNKILNAIMGR